MLALRVAMKKRAVLSKGGYAINTVENRQDLGQVYFLLKKIQRGKRTLQAAIDQGSPEIERLTTILNKIEELGY